MAFGFPGLAGTKPAAARSEVHSLDSHPSDVSDAEDNDNAERDVEAGSVDFHHHGDDPSHSDTGSDVDDGATGGAAPRGGTGLEHLDLGLGLGLVGGDPDDDDDDDDDGDDDVGSGVRGVRGVGMLSAECSEGEEGSGGSSSRRLFRGLSDLEPEVGAGLASPSVL